MPKLRAFILSVMYSGVHVHISHELTGGTAATVSDNNASRVMDRRLARPLRSSDNIITAQLLNDTYYSLQRPYIYQQGPHQKTLSTLI